MRSRWTFVALLAACGLLLPGIRAETAAVPQRGVFETALEATGSYANPYTELTADAVVTGPGGAARSVPLFWDGGSTWKLRFSPDAAGTWKWKVKSGDAGLESRAGSFTVARSNRPGSVRPMGGYPDHFERQDGGRFWFMGDTAWALYTDSAEERHDRAAAERYVDRRAGQGFNVLHSMLLSEAGWGNSGGLPFDDLASERIRPSYWQEVDRRLAYANGRGIVCGLALAWGDKRRQEPYAWRRFPSLEARKRYARYVAARYAAYDVYFIVSGEWHAEVRTRDRATENAVRKEFFEIGDALRAADAHGRMIAIHPMTSHGSVRDFAPASWMSFGDYQQNYRELHARALASRSARKPVVNSEYGYLLRDQSGDGVPDKDNSTSLEAMRHATWDIVMAGAYVVTGFGTTYFGGNRDPGPFDLEASKNAAWEAQMGHMKRLFASLEWWKLEPHDELLRSQTPRGADRTELRQAAPPAATYWCLAEPGRQYVVYVRGTRDAVELSLPAGARLQARQWNPRTGESKRLGPTKGTTFEYRAPDDEDWVVVLR